jgi:tight adherence protein B
MALTLTLVTFLAAIVVFLAIWLFVGTETNQEVISQRFEAVRKAERRGEISLDLKLIRDEMYSTVPMLHRLMMKLSWSGRLQNLIVQAGMKTRPAKVLLLTSVLGIGGYVLVLRFYHLSVLALVMGLVCAIIPVAGLMLKRRRRLRAFEERFPEALDLLGRAVRAGHPFTGGLEMVSKESPEPVGGEFRKTFEEQNFGLPLRDTLINMAERVPLVDVRFFVTALLVQKETGGNLAEILDELARVIRERFRIYREVQVKTAQGRLTAMILIAMPVAMMVALELVNPGYMQVLFHDPLGPSILGGAAVMQVIGSFILWRIVQIKV